VRQPLKGGASENNLRDVPLANNFRDSLGDAAPLACVRIT
jgi:hypothetical protein